MEGKAKRQDKERILLGFVVYEMASRTGYGEVDAADASCRPRLPPDAL